MYKTPTFAEPQQCNIPFSWGHVSAFIKINTETGMLLLRSEWKVQGRTQVKYLIGQFLNSKNSSKFAFKLHFYSKKLKHFYFFYWNAIYIIF
jgi:hypothetical protein